MTEEVEYEEAEEVQAEAAPVESKPRRTRKPSLKDWVRVIKSQGNTLKNTTIHLIINKATGLAELVTNAPASDGSTELEGDRTQVFAITSYEVIDDADRDPLGAAEAAAEAAAKEAAAEKKAAKAAEKKLAAEAKAAVAEAKATVAEEEAQASAEG